MYVCPSIFTTTIPASHFEEVLWRTQAIAVLSASSVHPREIFISSVLLQLEVHTLQRTESITATLPNGMVGTAHSPSLAAVHSRTDEDRDQRCYMVANSCKLKIQLISSYLYFVSRFPFSDGQTQIEVPSAGHAFPNLTSVAVSQHLNPVFMCGRQVCFLGDPNNHTAPNT